MSSGRIYRARMSLSRRIGESPQKPRWALSTAHARLRLSGYFLWPAGLAKLVMRFLPSTLAECELCTATLAEIRCGQRASGRRLSRNKLVFAAIAAAVLIVVLLATWLMRSRFPSETVTADLRNITRGVDNSQDSGVILHRNTRHLRILLGPEAVEGQYEVAVFNPVDRTSPLITRSASSSRENDSLVLEASVVVSNLQSGPYLLGIRYDHSEWAYYAIRID